MMNEGITVLLVLKYYYWNELWFVNRRMLLVRQNIPPCQHQLIPWYIPSSASFIPSACFLNRCWKNIR